MNIVRYSYPTFRTFARSPWSGLESEVSRLFDTAVGEYASASFPVSLREDKTNIFVRAELPGVNRDDISIEMADGQLTISATRKTPATEGQEEQSSRASRSVALNSDVQADKVTATYENGVLTVTLPKAEALQPRKIAIS